MQPRGRAGASWEDTAESKIDKEGELSPCSSMLFSISTTTAPQKKRKEKKKRISVAWPQINLKSLLNKEPGPLMSRCTVHYITCFWVLQLCNLGGEVAASGQLFPFMVPFLLCETGSAEWIQRYLTAPFTKRNLELRFAAKIYPRKFSMEMNFELTTILPCIENRN